MPTHSSITALKFGIAERDDLASHVLTLLYFYGVIAVALSFLVAIEAHLGMFTGLSDAEALLRVTGMDLITKELAGF